METRLSASPDEPGTTGDERDRMRVSSTVACAIAAARALEAVALWLPKLTQQDCIAVHRRLMERQEWSAATFFEMACARAGYPLPQ
jgi:hypothetical protein